MTQRVRLLGAVVALSLGLAACGSTAQSRGQQQAVGADLAGTGATAQPSAAPAEGTDTVTKGVPSDAGTAGAAASSGGTVPTSSEASPGAPAVSQPKAGSGTNAPAAAPIEVGFIASACSNCGAVLGTSYSTGTYSAQQLEQAMVNAVNLKGGILGHKVKPVFATVDTGSANWATDYQAACSTFTQDHHVVAVLGYSFAYEENLASCLSTHGILWINGGYGGGDKVAYTKYQHYFTSGAPSEDVELVLSVSSALQDRWISSASRLGILQASCPSDVRAYQRSLVPYLKAHHLNLVSDQTINCVGGASDDGSAVAAIQNAQLKMRADGVDAVIITGIPLILFAENASSQGWKPKYLTFLGGAAYEPYLAPSQLANIHAAGWLPTLDVNASQLGPLNTAQTTCKRLLHEGGADVAPAQYNDAFIACDGVQIYAAAIARAGGVTRPSVVSSALESLGATYRSAVNLDMGTLLSASRHDAPSAYRSNLYQAACKCFQYVGPARPFPTVP